MPRFRPFAVREAKGAAPPTDPPPSDTPFTESKSQTPLVALELSRQASFTTSGYAGLSRQGYRKNPVVYRCVRLVAEAAASVRLTVAGERADAVEALLASSSPLCPAGSTLESFYGQLQIAGSAYLEATLLNDTPVALRSLRPDAVEIAGGAKGHAVGWRVDRGGRRDLLRIDPVTFRSALMALHLFDPLEPASGHGPLEACAAAVDIHNGGAKWTKALLDNSARPSGALVYSGPSGGERLTDQQFDRLKAEMRNQYQGPQAAGRPLLLEGGLDWKPMAMSPADMDFIAARREAAREIAFAFGVPPMLLGIPGDNTYSNYREANLALWRQTVLPLVNRFAGGVEGWLRPWFGDDLSVRPGLDGVPALSEERDRLWKRVGEATFLSDTDRRRMLGLEVSDA